MTTLYTEVKSKSRVALRPFTATAAGVGVLLVHVAAHAEGAPLRRVDGGLVLSALHAFHVSGGTDPYSATSQGLALGLQPYGEWRVSDVVGVGLGVPLTINAPGASSNAYDIGFTPLVRLGYPAENWLYPFILVEAGAAWSRQPAHAWLSGARWSARAGTRIPITSSFSGIAQLGYDYTSFSGQIPLYYATMGPPAPIQHASVKTSYLGAGLGFELAF